MKSHLIGILTKEQNYNKLKIVIEKYIDKMLLFPKLEDTFVDNFNNLIFSFLNATNE